MFPMFRYSVCSDRITVANCKTTVGNRSTVISCVFPQGREAQREKSCNEKIDGNKRLSGCEKKQMKKKKLQKTPNRRNDVKKQWLFSN